MGSGKQKKQRAGQVGVDRARDVALFRYALIRTAADESLTTRQRGVLVRELAAMEHTGPFGERVRVSRVTLDRWVRAWRVGGFDALMPSPRAVQPRTPAQVLELAAALKREKPARTAAQVAAILTAHCGSAPSARTLQRHGRARKQRNLMRGETGTVLGPPPLPLSAGGHPGHDLSLPVWWGQGGGGAQLLFHACSTPKHCGWSEPRPRQDSNLQPTD